MGVTDHSEYVGTVRLANEPGSFLSKLPIAQKLVVHDAADVQRIYLWLGTAMIEGKPVKELVVPEIAGTVWKENNQFADQANEPGKFTAFCSYEWTSTPDYRNLHRNVFFRDCAKVPEMPFSSIDSSHPEDLWSWMDAQRKAGNELLAISHNANLSDGHMYPIDVDSNGRPIDAAWAASRDRNERLVEIKQIKGQSETHPLLSPNDEFANYEIMSYLLGNPEGRFDHIVGSYRAPGPQGRPDDAGHARATTRTTSASSAAPTRTTPAVPYRQDNFFGGHASLDGRSRDACPAICSPVSTYGSRIPPASPASGRRRTPAPRSSTACSARRPSAPAARTTSCASSAAGSIAGDLVSAARTG